MLLLIAFTCYREVPGRPILYLKPPSEPPSPPRTTTDSGFISKSSSSSSSSRGETPPTASNKVLVSRSLKENIYKLLEAHPKGMFAMRLAKEYEKMFDRAPPKEILEIARGLPFVIVEEYVQYVTCTLLTHTHSPFMNYYYKIHCHGFLNCNRTSCLE